MPIYKITQATTGEIISPMDRPPRLRFSASEPRPEPGKTVYWAEATDALDAICWLLGVPSRPFVGWWQEQILLLWESMTRSRDVVTRPPMWSELARVDDDPTASPVYWSMTDDGKYAELLHRRNIRLDGKGVPEVLVFAEEDEHLYYLSSRPLGLWPNPLDGAGPQWQSYTPVMICFERLLWFNKIAGNPIPSEGRGAMRRFTQLLEEGNAPEDAFTALAEGRAEKSDTTE